MKVTYLLYSSIFFCVICVAKTQYYDWSSFGEMINRQVQEQIRKINYNVNQQVHDINENVRRQVNKANQDVNDNIHKMEQELATLGPKINAEVQESLQPLEALKIHSKMAKGIGGVTIATYGDLQTFFYKNGKKYKCPGDIIENNPNDPPSCTETLTTNLTPEETICSDNAYSRVNNIFCFGPNSSITCSYNSCKCLGGTLFTLSGLKNICGSNYGSNKYVKYIYFPKITDKNHIKLPNCNKHVNCEETDSKFKCTWYGPAFVIDY